jgi:hypothetical protein
MCYFLYGYLLKIRDDYYINYDTHPLLSHPAPNDQVPPLSIIWLVVTCALPVLLVSLPPQGFIFADSQKLNGYCRLFFGVAPAADKFHLCAIVLAN